MKKLHLPSIARIKLTRQRAWTGMLMAGVLMFVAGGWLMINQLSQFQTQTIAAPVSTVKKPVTPVVAQRQIIKGNPVKIDIPSLGISLDIAPGEYNADTKKWNVSTDKAHYATMTPEPNDFGGNTFIYGHYRSNIFASLHKIKPGENAIVTTDNGHVFYYQLIESKVVEPADTAGVFDYQGKPILTVQTCTGFMYSKRQLFTFDLQRVV